MIKAIIVDDEPVAIRHLKKILISLHANIEIIDEVSDPYRVISVVRNKLPDIIFLDIDLKRKDINGLLLADKIFEQLPAIIIIYISAHNEFKPEAWERRAVVLGYIDKPFNRIKVERVLLKVARYISCDRVAIKDKNNGFHYFSPAEVIIIEREKNTKNTIVHCDNKKLITSESLSAIEGKLIGTNLLRVSRSYIINSTKIESVLLFSKSTYQIKFKDCRCVAYVSRETAGELGLIGQKTITNIFRQDGR